MQFNNTTNKNGLIQLCEFLTQIGDTNISGDTTLLKTFTMLINNGYHKAESIILASQDEWDFDDSNNSDFPIGTANLVADQQDYALPTSLKIKRVEITFDGTKWYKAEPFDINERGRATDTTSISQDFFQTEPKYDIMDSSLFMYPIPGVNITSGLKVWFIRIVAPFVSTDTTKEPGFDGLWHEYVALYASHEWARTKGKSNADKLKRDLLQMESDMRDYFSDKQEDRQNVLKPSLIDSDYL